MARPSPPRKEWCQRIDGPWICGNDIPLVGALAHSGGDPPACAAHGV
jgi:hypothetical protein